jgi:GT2 family glycosyltransferase
MTVGCMERLIAAGCDNASLRVVLVDNASTVSIANRVIDTWPAVDVRRSDRNRGFAGGVNIGLEDLDGVDFVALVNNDMVVAPGWLEPLVEVLDADAAVAAACPKIVFTDRFRAVDLAIDGRVRVYDVAVDGVTSTAPQLVSGFDSPQRVGGNGDWFRWAGPGARLHVPVAWSLGASGPGRARLRLGADAPARVNAQSGQRTTALTVTPGTEWYEIALDGVPFEVINNVGTVMLDDGYGADRGFMEEDRGQYDEAEDVMAWCGGAVLLWAEHLRTVGLFDERLFLYYEDLDLSLRGAAAGRRFRYEPASTVRHRHGATAVHGSEMAEYFKERNRLLVVLRHSGWRAALLAATRFLLATASYARRDLVMPVARRQRPDATIVGRRLRSFAGALRLAPAFRPGPARSHRGRTDR